MHSRKYQISTEPVSPSVYLSESDFDEHWFIGAIADYVNDDVDHDEEIQSLREMLEQRQIAVFNEDGSFTLMPHGKNSYFKGDYERFKEAVHKAVSMTLEEFVDYAKSFNTMFQIKDSYCDKYGLYVSSDDFGTIPFDEFVRRAKPETPYFIGAVLDYHW